MNKIKMIKLPKTVSLTKKKFNAGSFSLPLELNSLPKPIFDKIINYLKQGLKIRKDAILKHITIENVSFRYTTIQESKKCHYCTQPSLNTKLCKYQKEIRVYDKRKKNYYINGEYKKKFVYTKPVYVCEDCLKNFKERGTKVRYVRKKVMENEKHSI